MVNHSAAGRCQVVGARGNLTATSEGALYCFANDMYHMYWNNFGAVSLSVAEACR